MEIPIGHLKQLLTILTSIVLVFQGVSTGRIMVGCAMGSKEAACSKWSDPSHQECCCKPGQTKGMACCLLPKTHGGPALSALSKSGCNCRFITSTLPTQHHRVIVSASLTHFPNALQTRLQIISFVCGLEPNVVGTDSSPPPSFCSVYHSPRAPPIAAVD